MKALRGFPALRIRWWADGNPFKGHVVGKSKPPSFILGGAVSRGEIPINQVYLGLPFKASGCKIRRNVGVVTKCWFQPRFGSLFTLARSDPIPRIAGAASPAIESARSAWAIIVAQRAKDAKYLNLSRDMQLNSLQSFL